MPAVRIARCFDPRSHVGSDLADQLGEATACVSIHAPTWGATKVVALPPRTIPFRSTLPRGERPASLHHRRSARFRSTLPRGERPGPGRSSRRCRSFDPRSHVGSDAADGFRPMPDWRFDPRSHVGSDLIALPTAPSMRVSIHAPTWGATALGQVLGWCALVSIHAPTWGATACGWLSKVGSEFRSTLPRGERQWPHSCSCHCRPFRSTLPRGERPPAPD